MKMKEKLTGEKSSHGMLHNENTKKSSHRMLHCHRPKKPIFLPCIIGILPIFYNKILGYLKNCIFEKF